MMTSRPSDVTWARKSSGEITGLGIDIIAGDEIVGNCSVRVDGEKDKSNDASWDVQHPFLMLRNVGTFL